MPASCDRLLGMPTRGFEFEVMPERVKRGQLRAMRRCFVAVVVCCCCDFGVVAGIFLLLSSS